MLWTGAADRVVRRKLVLVSLLGVAVWFLSHGNAEDLAANDDPSEWLADLDEPVLLPDASIGFGGHRW
ncbi:hypothetical protein SAMN05421835_11563 [Amycolatopsis sacchari]|uniref:Uncharacterized protein n=1 Tax=Amycolatopsis sacchari TaxID=115433 RepID=A0A1I3XF56_9PSEU|nr:hypothetical protein SAMN05421835_11563 [Amycolatopsis sacchari]